MILMASETRQLFKSLTYAKELIMNGHTKEGIEVIEKAVNSSNIKEANWVICNIIDAASCNAVVSVLDSIGKIFDISACGNVKRVIKCYDLAKKDSEFVDIAINALIARGKKDQLDKLLPELTYGKILLKLSQVYAKFKEERKARELMKKACEQGEKEACENINQLSTYS